MALVVVVNLRDSSTIIFFDDPITLMQLKNSLTNDNINIINIIINIVKINQIILITKIIKKFPKAALFAFFDPAVYGESLSSKGVRAESELGKRYEATHVLEVRPGKKELSQTGQYIKPLHSEQPNLTPREKELLKLLYHGNSYSTCANAMNISLSTVQTHVRNTYRKLAVNNIRQAILKVQSRDLLDF